MRQDRLFETAEHVVVQRLPIFAERRFPLLRIARLAVRRLPIVFCERTRSQRAKPAYARHVRRPKNSAIWRANTDCRGSFPAFHEFRSGGPSARRRLQTASRNASLHGLSDLPASTISNASDQGFFFGSSRRARSISARTAESAGVLACPASRAADHRVLGRLGRLRTGGGFHN